MAKKRKRSSPGPPNRQVDMSKIAKVSAAPDPLPVVSHKSKGRYSGLGVNAFVWNLMVFNESCAEKDRLTNTGLEQAVRREFATRKTLIDALDRGSKINLWRRQFNLGTLVPLYGKPKRISLRYGNDHKPVALRRGLKHLDEMEIAEYCIDYEIDDDRYLKEIDLFKKAYKGIRE